MKVLAKEKEMVFLYHLSEELYKKPMLNKPSFSEIRLDKLIMLSMKNNMLNYHVKKMLDLYKKELDDKMVEAFSNIKKGGEKELERIKDTILILNSCLRNYLLVKTYRGYSRLPNDLDVLVPDFKSAFQRLKAKGFQNVNFSTALQESTLIYDELYKVHLHGKVSWAGGAKFMDDDLLFSSPRMIDFKGVKTKIPSFDIDFLIHIAHMNFEPLHITLSELLYLYKIASKVDWSFQFAQSKKYRWFKSFKKTLIIFDKIYHTLYNSPCPFVSLELDHSPSKNLDFIILPKPFSRRHLILTCFEKRLFIYPLTKLKKSLKILLTADTYKKYYTPVEYRIFKEDINKIFDKYD